MSGKMDVRLRRQYLEAMGIEVWLSREEAGTGVEEGAAKVPPAPPAESRPSEADPPPWMSEAPPMEEAYIPPEAGENDLQYADFGAPPAAPRNEVAGLDWEALQAKVKDCRACELRKGCTQTVFGVGNREADLLIIGEAPGADEDRQGEPFVGRAGKLLNAMLFAAGLQREQVFIANILKCRPPGNRDPKPEEALRCEPYLLRQVELIAPKVIMAVGRISAQNLLSTTEAVGRLRGRVHRLRDTGIPLVVTYHPAYLLRSPDQKAKSWQDLQQVMKLLK